MAILGAGGQLYFRDVTEGNCASRVAAPGSTVSLPGRWRSTTDAETPCGVAAYLQGQLANAAGKSDPPTLLATPVGGFPPQTADGSARTTSFTTACAGAAGSRVVDQAWLEACGFPSMHTTGPASGTVLKTSGGFTASKPGAVYNGLNVNGEISVVADNVTIENSDITDVDLSNAAIQVAPHVTGLRILNDSIHGTNRVASGSLAAGISYFGSAIGGVKVDHTNFYNGDRILNGYGTITDSYCFGGAKFDDEHDECIYTDGGGAGIRVVHDTLINANPWQTAAVFIDSPDGSGSDGTSTIDIENSLLAGGGYCLYGGEGSGGTHHTGPETIRDDRFANVYFSQCGQFGATAYMPADVSWFGNVWDGNSGSIASP